MVVSEAPGNVFFFGEHAVVYSKPAIVASIDLRTKCTMHNLRTKEIIISSHEIGKAGLINNKKKGDKSLFVLLDLCKELLDIFRIKRGVRAEIESNIPIASGLSSSSAVLCSVLSSFLKLFEIDLPKEKHFPYLIKFQKEIHGGRASGAEIISSSVGGLNYITFRNKVVHVKNFKNLPLKIVVGVTDIRKKTSETAGTYVPDLMKKRPKLVKDSFDKIGLICEQGFAAIEEKDIVRLGSLMVQNQKILVSLGLSHPKIDFAVKEALKAGAYGAKLSGKGQGGAMFALTDWSNQEEVANAIKAAGLKTIKTDIMVQGVR